MDSLHNIYSEGVNILKAAGIAEAQLDARLLLEYVTAADQNALLVHGDDIVPSGKIIEFMELINKRAKRIPLQHLVGSTCFMGLDFIVDEHVLIPRQDTECLVEEALIYGNDGDRILDMCTGSGCILLSIMHYKNDIEGFGIDISEDALFIAKKNAEKCDFAEGQDKIHFIKSDLFSELSDEYKESFDMIVSNPPYIPPKVIETLEPEVRDYEPRIALDGGIDGLDFYRKITKGAVEYLKKGGYLLYEIGYDQANAVKNIMEEMGFKEVRVFKDLAGLDRVVSGYL